MNQITYDIVTMLLSLVALLISITLHEVAHGWASLKLGDDTARSFGRLSLNPFAHINPMAFGLLALLMILSTFRGGGATSGFAMSLLSVVVCFSFARPVPVSNRGLKNPVKDMALIALAGPVTNIIVALVAMILLKYTPYLMFSDSEFLVYVAFLLMYFFSYIVQLNVGLAVFNLVPIPPLDGSKILYAFLPRKLLITFVSYERYITMGLFVLLILGVLDRPLDIAGSYVISGLDFLVNLLP